MTDTPMDHDEQRRAELRHWPYTLHQIDETLDTGLIEARGRQLLYQAIGAERLTVYAGSGLSSGYGRMVWPEWTAKVFGNTDRLARQFKALAEASGAYMTAVCAWLADHPDPDLDEAEEGEVHRLRRILDDRRITIELACAEVSKLHGTFKLTVMHGAKFPDGDGFPIQLQITGQLHELLRSYADLMLGIDVDEGARAKPAPLGLRRARGQNLPRETIERVHATILGAAMPGVSEAREAQENFHIAYAAYVRLADRPEASLSFDTLNRNYFADECSQAELMLMRALRDPAQDDSADEHWRDVRDDLSRTLNVLNGKNLRRDPHSYRDDHERYRVMSAFTIRRCMDLIVATRAAPHIKGTLWDRMLGALMDRLVAYTNDRAQDGRGDRTFLTPSSRYLIEVLMLLNEPGGPDWPGGAKTALTVDERVGNLLETLVPDVGQDAVNSRRSFVAERFDIVNKLVNGLKADRFVTTNYDHEIERYFQDIGFRPYGRTFNDDARNPQTHGDVQVNALGSVMRDHAFQREQAGQLIGFSAGTDRADFAVHHLHGRATAEGDLVATERDYMDLYLRRDQHRDVVDEAIGLTFSSSPILFTGLGMSEADVLRPLRQFISDSDRTAGYNAMVLLPAKEPHCERVQTSAGLFMRYGVHTIHYGSGEVALLPGTHGEDAGRRIGIDWMFRVLRLSDTLGKLLTDIEKGPKAEYADRDARLKVLCDAVEKMGPDLAQDGVRQDVEALWVLCGRLTAPAATEPLEVQVPWFTSLRPGRDSEAQAARDRHRRPDLQGDDYVGFYVAQINWMLAMVLDAPATGVPGGARGAAAMRATLQGAKGALFTACLNAGLQSIAAEYRDWWREWQESPPHRVARFFRMEPPGPPDGNPDAEMRMMPVPRRYVRHQVINTYTNLDRAESRFAAPIAPCDDLIKDIPDARQVAPTGVRSFDTFVDALADHVQRVAHPSGETPNEQRLGNGRRLYTIAARRGLGKGSFMSAFATTLGLTGYIEAGWARRLEEEPGPPIYVGSLFINLSFSSEIASVYDMAAWALTACVCRIRALRSYAHERLSHEMPSDAREATLRRALAALMEETGTGISDDDVEWLKTAFRAEDKALRLTLEDLPRMSRLQRLAQEFATDSRWHAIEPAEHGLGLRRPARILIVINAMDLLFTNDREPKNSEIQKLLEFLVDIDGRDTPLDIVGIGSEERFGWPWPTVSAKSRPKPDRTDTSEISQIRAPIETVRLDRRGMAREADESIRHRMASAQIVDCPEMEKGALVFKPPGAATNMIHFARAAEPTKILVSNFRLLTACLYVRALAERLADEDHYPEGRDDAPNLADVRALEMRGAFVAWRAAHDALWRDGVPGIAACEATVLKRDYTLIAGLAGVLGRFPSIAADRQEDEEREAARNRDALARDLLEMIPEDPADADAETQRRVVDLFADASTERYKMDPRSDLREWRVIRRVLNANRFSLTILLAAAQEIAMREPTMVAGAEQAEQFLRDVVEQLRGSSQTRREELILDAAISTYERFHVIDRPETNFVLQQLILRHLAAIGAPVGADVLARVPAVRAGLRHLNGGGRASDEALTARVMASMCDRGLLFRVAPHPRLRDLAVKQAARDGRPVVDTSQTFRYALHRSIQRRILLYFGTMTEDPVSVNNFSPSLYASMSSGLARLNYGSYQFLSELMLSLSQYPDIPLDKARNAAWDFPFRSFLDAEKAVQVQALRAALSMVRSSFSIAVVSRFEDYRMEPGTQERKRSYFEEYRVQLRWIIRKAWELLDARDYAEQAGPNLNRYNPGADWNQINALYRDEVVWLYNEVGLTCLVEGNMVEAVTHLRQAIQFNRDIEGRDETGLQHNRIALNLAIAQIQRGRIGSARARLEDVILSERERRGRLYHLARGYRAVCCHLMGDMAQAAKDFKKSHRYLTARRDFRGMATIGQNYSSFLAATGSDKSLRLLDDALRAAESGGHEDIRRHIMIASIHQRLERARDGDPGEREAVLRTSATRLEGVLEYAQMMGIRTLEADALRTRALILEQQNETGLAGRLLIQSIAICRRNGMQLRLNAALTLYAKVLISRGKPQMAERLLRQSLDMAKQQAYRTEVVRVQSILSNLRRME